MFRYIWVSEEDFTSLGFYGSPTELDEGFGDFLNTD
jgi:hypothetical protein